ncbi:hypothetical protein CapIbe_006718 [Capra ibex]
MRTPGGRGRCGGRLETACGLGGKSPRAPVLSAERRSRQQLSARRAYRAAIVSLRGKSTSRFVLCWLVSGPLPSATPLKVCPSHEVPEVPILLLEKSPGFAQLLRCSHLFIKACLLIKSFLQS